MSNYSEEKLNKKAPSPEESGGEQRAYDIPARRSSVSPLQAVRESVMKNARGVEEPPVKAEEKPQAPAEEKPPVKVEEKAEVKAEEQKPRVTKTSTLLAKCMPYIYDDDGINYAEEKPNYTLESVEDIIQSAERRANEKIARMYNLKSSDIESIGMKKAEKPQPPEEAPRARLTRQTGSFPIRSRIGDEARPASNFDTVSIPKVSTTLFDDFSARRTEITEGDNVTTTYTELGQRQTADSHTRAIPDMKVETNTREIFEDILSHTRPADVIDLPSSSKRAASRPEESATPQADEFTGAHDVKRVGTQLKLEALMARLRFVVSALLTLIVAAFQVPVIKDAAAGSPLGTIFTLICFGLALLVNYNVFSGFKSAFTKASSTRLPLALALTATAVYIICGIIGGSYPYEAALPAMLALVGYTYFEKRRTAAVFGNFRIVASRKEKNAVALLDKTEITAPMVRGSIEGEVLVAGCRKTDEIEDFLKNTRADSSFGGKMGSYSLVCLIAAVIIAVIVGISMGDFSAALLALSLVLSLSAAPSVWVADLLPLAGLNDRLKEDRAGVCSRYSAHHIEEANAVVVTSADIFPSGCIKLYNMRPLDANNIDETLVMAAAVAKEANSPLYPMFMKIITSDIDLPAADTVKYEDNLGISGWSQDKHVMVGNRSLMQAHGVRVPSLEVDRKILHKGFFPIYIACEQRACALLVVKYTIHRRVEAELHRLADAGVTLLIDNSDPNVTEEMICDYYSLYPDIIKILDHHGAHKYRTATEKTEQAEAHGFCLGSSLGFMSLISGCIRLRRLSSVLYAAQIICAVLMWIFFLGFSLGGAMELMSAAVAALCQLASTVITLIIYFIGKP